MEDLKPESTYLLNEEENYQPSNHPSRRWPSKLLLYGIIAFLFGLNLLQPLIYQAYKLDKCASHQLSHFAALKDNEISGGFVAYTEYSTANATQRDHLWNQITQGTNTVAVEKWWAQEKGLPPGRDLPWDDSKTLYFVNAYHNLHCLKNIYISIREYQLSLTQTTPEHHIFHCLDQLRADVVCSADDSLRAGIDGQPRRCRSFDKLNAWMKAHPGCLQEDPDFLDDGQALIASDLHAC